MQLLPTVRGQGGPREAANKEQGAPQCARLVADRRLIFCCYWLPVGSMIVFSSERRRSISLIFSAIRAKRAS